MKHTKPTNLSELQSVVDRVHGVAGIVAAAEDHCLTLEEVNIKRYFLMGGQCDVHSDWQAATS